MSNRFTVDTKTHTEFIDITHKVQKALTESGIQNGMCTVFVPHTTAGVTINENADPDVKTDIIATLERAFPWRGSYRHMEGNSAAHIKASMMGFSLSIPVENGRFAFGTWQCIYFCEFDGPRSRKVIVTVTGI
ncbi:secondary thiamine-phosphate synthase enzyme YjbQ [Candidatus Latescibacterota bacterium]